MVSKMTIIAVLVSCLLLINIKLSTSFALFGQNYHLKHNVPTTFISSSLITAPTKLTHLSAVSDFVDVDLGDRSYPIYIGRDLLNTGDELRKHVTSKKALIVTNTKIGPLYTARVRANLEKNGVEVFEVVLPDGEEFKTMDVMMKIIDKSMEIKLDRKSTMIALGGGVIGERNFKSCASLGHYIVCNSL